MKFEKIEEIACKEFELNIEYQKPIIHNGDYIFYMWDDWIMMGTIFIKNIFKRGNSTSKSENSKVL